MGQPHQSNAPTYGVLIRCTIENSHREGRMAWIDLEELEDEEHADFLVGQLTGKTDDPYPDSWHDEGTFEVERTQGLGRRLACLASDAEMPGLVMQTWADLAAAIQELELVEIAPFLAWADEEDSWLPGYGVHPPCDAVLWFRCSGAAIALPTE